MKRFHPSWVALAATALLVACSGGGAGDQSPRVTYGKIVTFGDSLSDVGSYNVGVVASMGGGRYSINTGEALNWTELLASTLGVDELCAAQTGLNSAAEGACSAPLSSTSSTVSAGATRPDRMSQVVVASSAPSK